MMGFLQTPGIQHMAHMVKAGMGSGGEPAQESQLHRTRIMSAFTGKDALMCVKSIMKCMKK
jgi:hypothetical protein